MTSSLADALNKALDVIREEAPELTTDQAVMKTMAVNLYALVINLAEAGVEQARPDGMMLINFAVLNGILESLVWMNDQIELSTLTAENFFKED